MNEPHLHRSADLPFAGDMRELFGRLRDIAAVLVLLAAPAGADETQNYNALIQNLVPPDGPSVLTFRGGGLHTITLQPDKAANTPTAEFDVDFRPGESALSSEAKQVLGRHRSDLASEARAGRLVIEGHGDSTDEAADRNALATRRADAVRDYIVRSFAVDPARVKVVAIGDSANPGTIANRRVHVATFAH
jgi:outer membrane protein OmpA-like peptidoglycan-associated protein